MARSVNWWRLDRRGWTVVDALLSMMFLGLLAGILQSFATTSLHALRVRQVADDLDETARIALDIMARDIRDVGYGLPDAGDRGLRAASGTHIRLARDLDLDGETSSANERVGYALDSEFGQLRRQLGGASPQPMVQDVDAEQVLFRFLDEAGNEIGAEGIELEAGQRADVRQIEITLRLSAPHPVAGSRDRIAVEHRTSVGLRNGQL